MFFLLHRVAAEGERSCEEMSKDRVDPRVTAGQDNYAGRVTENGLVDNLDICEISVICARRY